MTSRVCKHRLRLHFFCPSVDEGCQFSSILQMVLKSRQYHRKVLQYPQSTPFGMGLETSYTMPILFGHMPISYIELTLCYGILSDVQLTNVRLAETFKYTAKRGTYCKKLVENSLAFVNLVESKDCDWYSYYVAWYLSCAVAIHCMPTSTYGIRSDWILYLLFWMPLVPDKMLRMLLRRQLTWTPLEKQRRPYTGHKV